jgi:hypothetical protein
LVSIESFRTLALSFPGAAEAPHFERIAFKTKKTFATLDPKGPLACLMLSPVDQSVFCSIDKTIIYPVPNKWGLQGATYFELSKIKKTILKDALQQAYSRSIEKPKKKI